MVSRNFLGNKSFSVRPPLAGNSYLVVFGPILGLWHLDKLRAQAENTKTQFPGARGTCGGEIRPPKNPPPGIMQLFYI